MAEKVTDVDINKATIEAQRAIRRICHRLLSKYDVSHLNHLVKNKGRELEFLIRIEQSILTKETISDKEHQWVEAQLKSNFAPAGYNVIYAILRFKSHVQIFVGLELDECQ